jgi:hypothetical protein
MYPQDVLVGAIVRNSNAFDTAQSITAAAAVYGSYSVLYPIMVQRYMFRMSAAASDLTSSVVEMQKVTVADVTTSVTTITVPNGTGAGKVLIKDFGPVKFGIGDKLQFKLKTQGGLGGTPAGAGFHGFLASLQPEYYGNETNAVVSA